jgi:hypothetical protein
VESKSGAGWRSPSWQFSSERLLDGRDHAPVVAGGGSARPLYELGVVPEGGERRGGVAGVREAARRDFAPAARIGLVTAGEQPNRTRRSALPEPVELCVPDHRRGGRHHERAGIDEPLGENGACLGRARIEGVDRFQPVLEGWAPRHAPHAFTPPPSDQLAL